jgi:diamine N-acetyltransferase
MPFDNKITLRAATLEDTPMLLAWENSTDAQVVTQAQEPLSTEFVARHILSSQNLATDLQQRFIVLDGSGSPIGTVDLFDYSPATTNADIGIYITPEARQQGYATQAITLAATKAQQYGVRYLYADIQVGNTASLALFRKLGFTPIHTESSEIIRTVLAL